MGRLIHATLLIALFAGCTEMQAPDSSDGVATQSIVVPGPWVFEPSHAKVKAGEPVTFHNHGGADHTVTFEGIDFDENIGPGEKATITIVEPGVYPYTCKYHPPDMKGIISVE